jgi:hypothetical protein
MQQLGAFIIGQSQRSGEPVERVGERKATHSTFQVRNCANAEA